MLRHVRASLSLGLVEVRRRLFGQFSQSGLDLGLGLCCLIHVGLGLRQVKHQPFCSSNISKNEGQQKTKIRSWSFKLNNSFGKVISNTSFPMLIVPLNPVKFPSSDQIFVHLLESPVTISNCSNKFNDSSYSSSVTLSSFKDNILTIRGGTCVEDDEENVSQNSCSFQWYIEVPTCFDLHLKSFEQGHITVERFENDICDVKTEYGDCIMKSIKTKKATVASESGNISVERSLHGNATLTTSNNGVIKSDKIQGNVVKLTSSEGSITCSDIYANTVELKTTTGSIYSGNLHGECDVKTTSGNINIGSLDGSLYSETIDGDLDVYAIRHKDINIINGNGDVIVKLPSEISTNIELQGANITLPESMQFNKYSKDEMGNVTNVKGTIGEDHYDNRIQIKATNGNIELKNLSWFQSLSLK